MNFSKQSNQFMQRGEKGGSACVPLEKTSCRGISKCLECV
jgi:hypothetical protein